MADNRDFRLLIDQISNGFNGAQVVLTATRLGLWEALAHGGMSASELARRLGGDERALRIISDALAALSLLEKDGEIYRHTEAGRALLTPDSPDSVLDILKYKATLYERWGKLYDVVKSGKCVVEEQIEPRLAVSREAFACAMANVAQPVVAEAIQALDLSGVRTLLDIGGGPGVYAIEFARAYPELQVVILDNHETLKVARRNVSAAGLQDRIMLQPGDALLDNLSEEFDFIFISNVIHSLSAGKNAELVKLCAGYLTSGGRLCIKDFILEPSRISPSAAAVFAVNMLVNTDCGDCYTAEQIEDWLCGAGLHNFQRISLTPPSSMVLGTV